MPSLLGLGTVDSSLLPVLIDEFFTDWCTTSRVVVFFISGEDNYYCGQTDVVSLLIWWIRPVIYAIPPTIGWVWLY